MTRKKATSKAGASKGGDVEDKAFVIAALYASESHDNIPANPAAHTAWERAANDCERISEALAVRAMWLKTINTAPLAMDGLGAPLHAGEEPPAPALEPRNKIPEATRYFWEHVVPKIATNMTVDLKPLAMMGDADILDRAALAFRHAALYARATPQERVNSARVFRVVDGELKQTNVAEDRAYVRPPGGVRDVALDSALERAKRMGVPNTMLAAKLGKSPEALKQARRRRRRA